MGDMRKGVSPIVAAVVLLAVAITVGVVVSTWVSNWAATQISPESLACAAKTRYTIDSAKFNDSGDNKLILKLTNRGEVNLYGFGVYLDNGTVIRYYNSTSGEVAVDPSVSSTNPLAREETVYLDLDLTAAADESLNVFNRTLLKSLEEVRVTNLACESYTANNEIIMMPSG